MSPTVLWLIALPCGAIPVVYLLRRLRLGAIVAGLAALATAWFALDVPTGLFFELLGRVFSLNQLSKITIILTFGGAGLLFLISAAKSGDLIPVTNAI
ncbi:MAG: hypothetical protein AAF485_05480 [Chloroflexota bacterium]